MDCKINWTKRAWDTYQSNIQFLQNVWTEKEVSNFVLSVDRWLTGLQKQPKCGTPRNKENPNIRFSVVHKRIILVYKYKPAKKEIDLLVFWNTSRNPQKLKAK